MPTEDEQSLTAEITYYPPGVEEVELQTLVYGEDPLILIEPLQEGEGFSVKLSLIDPTLAAWAMGFLATTLEDEYGLPDLTEDDK